MGYFNIFYKITRIIDMLTRKRNRKIIITILIIIAVVFIFHNKVNAQTDLDNRITDFMHIRADIYQGQVAYYSLWVGTGNYAHLTVQPVKEGFTYEFNWDTGHALYFYYVSDLNQLMTYMTTGGDTPFINTNALPLIKLVPSSNNKFTYTCDNDGFLIISNFHSDSSITNYNDFNLYCNTDYNGQSNLNTINQDLLRIETLLKDYLYGDKDFYNISYTTFPYIRFDSSQKVVYSDGRGSIYEIKVKKGYTYKISFTNNATWRYAVPFAFSSNYIKPIVGTDLTTYYIGTHPLEIGTETTFTYNATNDGYLIFAFQNNYITLNSVTSNYNEGQENGLYGGLTDINDQTRLQGEQTRETITDTSIPTNEMTIDTSIVDGVSNEDNDNFLTSIINRFQSVITPSASVTTIVIPIPKTGKNIVLRSDLLSSHIGNTIIGTYITVFWYVVFFIYFFKFAYRVINWVVTGEIIEKPSGFMKYLMEQNAIITASMM